MTTTTTTMTATKATAIGALAVLDDAEAVAREAAARILEAARARPEVGLFLAGGSTARRAYEIVAERASPADFADAHVWLVDDRPVPLDHAESNAGLLLRLWGSLIAVGERFHTMTAADGIPAQIAALEAALRARGGSTPRPDLVVFGVGADGHVGGLLPGDPGLAANGLYTSVKDGFRLTGTRGLFTSSRRIAFLVAGAAKAELVARVQADPRATPAGMIASEAVAAGSEVTWLLDREAAARLA